ncbi:MAG TPA: LacI family transcriptional regulator [Firmicutes bacterium]|nr:LacI family transcriptional regulator [Bacillota bacterium]
MATIKEIAKLANVSTATVSYALNDPSKISEETRAKVMRVVEQVNYRPNSIAKSLKVKRTNAIGVITEDITVFNTPEIINGIGECAEEHNYHIILENIRLYKRIGNNYQDTSKFTGVIKDTTSVLMSKQVEGIIYVGAHCRDVTGLIDKTPIPVVYTYCYTQNEGDYTVNYDDFLAAYEATKYLIGMNHRKIALITGLMGSGQCQERIKGYQKALYESQVLFNPEYLKVGNWEREAGYEAGKELLTSVNRPTAIFALNDVMAGGVFDAAVELGLKIPEDLSLIGFDNRECSYSYSPKLTTMALPLDNIGNMATEILINSLSKQKQKSFPQHSKLKCALVERESVMPLLKGEL